jgi:predicted acylesterase/phospholipase RssA
VSYPTDPDLECDIVMKGGITSGVIYPGAVCELAKTYRLRSVGGSSAGAIAATATAAAEYGRTAGGFNVLAALPHDITHDSPAGGSVLFRLFQPTSKTRSLYRTFVAGMGKSANLRWTWTLAALFAGFWLRALACAIPGIALVGVSVFGSGPAVITGIAGGLIIMLLGAIIGAAWGAAAVLAQTPAAGFGLCTGMPGAGSKGAEALTPYLHRQFQAMAGRPDGPALTFGDLRDKDIELRVMTTNLTRRQPMPMPWSTHEYFFEPDEMRDLFPPDVVDWMIAHPPELGADGKALSDSDTRGRDLLRAQAGSKRPWPAPDDVPVLVATRMSLSFPLLITAVPLYAVDYSRQTNIAARNAADEWLDAHPHDPIDRAVADVQPKRVFERNWFSDGGICANLPVHFFDSPLPGRPTFAIDLESFPPDQPKDPNDQRQNCALPIANNVGLQQPWTALSPTDNTITAGITALGAFLAQIVDTARGWVDAAHLVMPGYRDRVVTVYNDATEGGMNLKMPGPVVRGLAERGEAAGAKLVDKFTGTPTDERGHTHTRGWGWNNQRWIRFRTAAAGLDEWLTLFKTVYEAASPPPTAPYDQLAGAAGARAVLPSYALADHDRDTVNHLTTSLLATAAMWSGENPLSEKPPHPQPRLRLVPDDGVASAATEDVNDQG